VARLLDLPLDPRALRRVRATLPQVGLDRAARRRNVHEAFVADAARVDGRCVALLDDVVTTASTVAAAALALRAAGARRIEVWCVARAPGVGHGVPGGYQGARDAATFAPRSARRGTSAESPYENR
jgi:predicted amidophosphoribosyltransferase